MNANENSTHELASAHRTIGNHTRFSPGRDNQACVKRTGGDKHGIQGATNSSLIDNRFELKEVLGEGGMGTVWLALQFEPVRREVAIKMIRAELVGTRFLTRFEAERQTLALMDHNNVAGLLDGGLTPDGAPYLVMELARGIPITDFCDTRRLTIQERLRLFIQVCQGVQHAHQKGVIHRDLKPANILVVDQAGQPVPKVIDFGLAKVMEFHPFSPEPGLTGTGIAIGTPLYMAPEQMEGRSGEVDIRADIYSLGVVLYELLTGATPLNPDQVQEYDVWEVLRRLDDDRLIRPSQRVSQSKDQALVDRRKVERNRFVRSLTSDLDWIVLKALSRNRDLRYAAVSDFIADIERYLDDQPVYARPPSSIYRIRKFVHRHRGSVASSVVVGLLLIGLTIFSILSAGRANQAALIAADRQAQTERSFELLSSVFQDLDQRTDTAGKESLPNRLTDKLKRAAGEVNERTFPDALVRARLLTDLAKAMIGLGQSAEAVALLEQAKKLRQDQLGADHEDTLDTANALASALLDTGRQEQGLALAKQVVKLAEARWGSADAKTLKFQTELGAALAQVGETENAMEIFRSSWTKSEQQFGPSHPDTLTARNNHAYVLLGMNRVAEAIPEFQQIVSLRRETLGETHLDTLGAISSLSSAYLYHEQPQAALEILQPAYKLLQEHQVSDHSVSLSIMTNLGSALTSCNQLNLAKDVLMDAYQTSRNKFGTIHESTYLALGNLGAVQRQLKEIDEAIESYEEARTIIRLLHGVNHAHYLAVLNNLQGLYAEQQNFERSIERLEEALKIRIGLLPTDHTDIWLTKRRIGYTRRDAGQLESAVSLLEEVYRHAPDRPEFLSAPVDWIEAKAKLAAPANQTGDSDSELEQNRESIAELVPQVISALKTRCRDNPQAQVEQLDRLNRVLQGLAMRP